jgi:hypothetical protein
MAERKSEEREVPISFSLPASLYGWIAFAAGQRGLTAGQHLRKWIIQSLKPWEAQEPLDQDAHSEGYSEAVPVPSEPLSSGPRREDFADIEAYLKAEQADRQAQGQATRKRNREAQPRKLPDHIKRIAEARRQLPALSLRQFSQLLFERGIYQSKPRDGGTKAVNSATLSVWLRQARDAGLLPQKAVPRRTVAYPRKPKSS